MAYPYELHDAVCEAHLLIEEASRTGRLTSAHKRQETIKQVRGLLEGGADVNTRDSTSRTPLDYCVVGVKPLPGGFAWIPEREKLLLLLFEHGASPNLQDRQGWTVMHQAAWNGDLHLLQYCVRNGKGDIRLRNSDGRMAVDLAAAKNHSDIMQYLDQHSGDLSSICRTVIRQALGKKCELARLRLPPRIHLFLRYNIPYPGFTAVLVPPAPWTAEQLYQHQVEGEELRGFITEHASEDFLSENAGLVGQGRGVTGNGQDLVRLFQDMYLWDAFKTMSYEEPLARQPRYSLEKLEKNCPLKLPDSYC